MSATSAARARRRQRPSGAEALRALGSSALALAGAAPAGAQASAEHWQYEYHSSNYRKDDLSASQGERGAELERVRVQVHQFQLSSPLPRLEQWDLGLGLVIESMSGASPIHSVPDSADGAIQVMSGATLEDERTDLNLAANYCLGEARIGFGTGVPRERDRSALRPSTRAERQFSEQNTTLGAGLAVSLDSISPERDPDPVGTQHGSDDQRTRALFASAEQLLDRSAALRSSLGAQGDRLAAFGSLSVGIDAEYRFRTSWTGGTQWQLKLSRERYASSENFALGGSGREVPGLVDWSLVWLGLGVRF